VNLVEAHFGLLEQAVELHQLAGVDPYVSGEGGQGSADAFGIDAHEAAREDHRLFAVHIAEVIPGERRLTGVRAGGVDEVEVGADRILGDDAMIRLNPGKSRVRAPLASVRSTGQPG